MIGKRTDRGTITLITGSMFSGKTTELLRQLDRVDPHRALAVKHASDLRFTNGLILTHGGKSRPAVTVNRAQDILEFAGDKVELVGIDDQLGTGRNMRRGHRQIGDVRPLPRPGHPNAAPHPDHCWPHDRGPLKL
ncbi:MAG: hypothetical protein HYR83_07655 [Planctomycetes bacterium]|nr:hypothetical protein [Planctomycetota bacterium]